MSDILLLEMWAVNKSFGLPSHYRSCDGSCDKVPLTGVAIHRIPTNLGNSIPNNLLELG